MIQEEDRRVPAAVSEEAEAIAALIGDVADRMAEGGRLFYVGAGTSGRLGVLDAAECPPTFGTDPHRVQGLIAGGREALVRSREGAEDDREAGRRTIRQAGVAGGDFVLGIATSGTTPFVRAAVEEADRLGAGTGFLSCTEPPDDVRGLADHLVTPLVGPEVIAGSTRMKAGTATKLVLNTLTTGVMVRLGKVYGNLMVDLRAVSRKLVDRSLRILSELCGLEGERARRLLVSAGGSVKTAVAMHELGASRAAAERVLDACEGFLRETLERFGGGAALPYYGCYPEELPAGGRPKITARLRDGPRRLRRACAEREAREDGPDDGEDARVEGLTHGWSPAEHLAHLVASEREAFRPRVEAILAAAPGERLEFPDWPPPDPPPESGRAPSELLGAFRRERDLTLEALEGAERRAWDRRAVVAGEEIALHQLLRGVAHHDRAHADRVTQWVHPDLAPGGGRPGRTGP